MKKLVPIILVIVFALSGTACLKFGKANNTPTAVPQQQSNVSMPSPVPTEITVILPTIQPKPTEVPTVSVPKATSTAAATAVTRSTPTQPSTPEPKQTPAATRTAAARSTVGATATTATKATPKAASSPTAISGIDPLAALQALVATKDHGNYRVAYNIVSLDGLGSQDSMMTFYHLGNKSRLDTASKDSSGSVKNGRLYFDDSQTSAFSCDESSPGVWNCVELTDDTAKMTIGIATFILEVPALIINTVATDGQAPDSVTTRKILGQDAQVYLFKAKPPEQGEAEFAFTNDGLLLLMDIRGSDKASDNGKIEATVFSRQVSDTDLTPPK